MASQKGKRRKGYPQNRQAVLGVGRGQRRLKKRNRNEDQKEGMQMSSIDSDSIHLRTVMADRSWYLIVLRGETYFENTPLDVNS